MLQIKDLTVKVGSKTILDRFSCSFNKDKVYVVMGPNGSGKSTLAFVIAGHPAYKISGGRIKYQGVDISDLSPEKRAKRGIFLSFQSPLTLTGVSVFQLLRTASVKKRDPLLLKKQIEKISKKLDIKKDLLERSLNEGASGGEKKKLEMLQAAIINPKLMIFDEIDTGVDVDALRKIAGFMDKFKKGKTLIIITHYNRILRYLTPDKVLVLIEGKLTKVGSKKLAETIERQGYKYATTTN